MNSIQCRAVCDRCSECKDVCDSNELKVLQNKLDSPMPWIGIYIAVASAVYSLAMVADAFHGFRSKMLWFPCKYFSLNAMSLTLLAVILKLPVDFTANLSGIHENLARVSSLVLMSTAMANFMTSLGSMHDNEMVLNLVALGIMIITIIGNVYVPLIQLLDNYSDVLIYYSEEIVATGFIFISLVMFCSSALTVLTTKRYIECKYQEKHKIALDEENVDGPKVPIDKLRLVVQKYWVMAVTGCPQFVMARSVTCSASGLMCVLVAITLAEAHIRMAKLYRDEETYSAYKWSIKWILYVQSVGVALGTIVPVFRWFNVAWFKCSDIGRKNFKIELKIENYWIQRLVDWRESSLPLQVRHHKWKKFLHAVRRLLLNCSLGVQILLVWTSKLVLLISASFFHHIKKLKIFVIGASDDTRGSESGGNVHLDLTHYVLLLPEEPGIPKETLKNIGNEVFKLMEKGKRQKPNNLIELLHKSTYFNGVREFDNNRVPRLHSQEPPNSWSLPVVTLTCIAIALPNISNDNANQLVKCVEKGLTLLKLIEKSLDKNGDLATIRDAADVAWVGVDLNCMWQDKDLRKISLQSRTSKEPLEELSSDAERTVKQFLRENDFLVDIPLNWPVKIIAANSMYRIFRTILLASGDNETDDGLFDHLSVMIADILAASLTNLPHVITTKCHHSSQKERQNSVRQAALLLGETEEILQILQQREIPSLDPDKAAYIDEWRTFIEADNGNSLASVSNIGSETQQSNEEHVANELQDRVENQS